MKSNDPMLLLDMPPLELALHFEEQEHTLEVEHLKQLYRDLTQMEKNARNFVNTSKSNNRFVPAAKACVHESLSKLDLIDRTITRLQNKEKIRSETANYTAQCLHNLNNRLNHNKLNALGITSILNNIIVLLSSPKVTVNAISALCENIYNTDFTIYKLLKLSCVETIIARSWENDALKINGIAEHILNSVDHLLFSSKPILSKHLQSGIDVCNMYLEGRMAYPLKFERSVSQRAYLKAIQSAFCTVRHGYRSIEFLHSSPKNEDIKQANTIYLYTRYECANGPANYCAMKDSAGEITYFELTHNILGEASTSVHAAIGYHHEMSPALEDIVINAVNRLKGYHYQLTPEEREDFLNTAYSEKQKQPTPIIEAVFRPAFQQAAHYVAKTHEILNAVHDIPEMQPLLENKKLTDHEKLQAIFSENPFQKKHSFFERIYINVNHWLKKLMGVFSYHALSTETQETHEKIWQSTQKEYATLEHNMEALLASSTAVAVPLLKSQFTLPPQNTDHLAEVEKHKVTPTLKL